MIMVIDIGNTNSVIGLYEKEKLVHCWRLTTHTNQTKDEYQLLFWNLFQSNKISASAVQKTIISCVVPPVIPVFQEAIEGFTGTPPQFVNASMDLGMPVLVDNPHEVGADRIVNAIGGFDKYKHPLIIVDFGTATTFDVVSDKGEYLGGVIMPGIRLSLEALRLNTSALPRVEIEAPPTVIGKNTRHSMQSGIFFGYSAMVDSLVKKISQELPYRPKVIATGGLANLIQNGSEHIESVHDDLTLWGLYIIFQRIIKSQP